MAKTVTCSKKCCKSSPRCKRCPVVMKRLSEIGQVERVSKRSYVIVDITAPALKAARAR